MTPRKLTPAEALAMFKDWQSPDVTIHGFIEKWYVPASPDSFADIAIAALEEALAQKPAAAPATGYVPTEHERRCAEEVAIWPEWKRPSTGSWCSPWLFKSEQSVPSDEEIVNSIPRWRLFELGRDKMTAMEDALRLLARRIGVQGVPQ